MKVNLPLVLLGQTILLPGFMMIASVSPMIALGLGIILIGVALVALGLD